MPGADVTVHAYSYFYGADGYWYFDNRATKSSPVLGVMTDTREDMWGSLACARSHSKTKEIRKIKSCVPYAKLYSQLACSAHKSLRRDHRQVITAQLGVMFS
jgi:hypothetical protein